jgi:thioredoxin
MNRDTFALPNVCIGRMNYEWLTTASASCFFFFYLCRHIYNYQTKELIMGKVYSKFRPMTSNLSAFRFSSFVSDRLRTKYGAFLFIVSLMLFNVNCSNAQSTGNGKGEVIVMNKADFLSKIYNYEKNSSEWVYEGKRPCIIDFYADWCGPCKRVAPVMKELAAEYKGRIDIYKIDVDSERELASVFGINSIPLILFVPLEGKPQAAAGALPKATIVEQIKEFLLVRE